MCARVCSCECVSACVSVRACVCTGQRSAVNADVDGLAPCAPVSAVGGAAAHHKLILSRRQFLQLHLRLTQTLFYLQTPTTHFTHKPSSINVCLTDVFSCLHTFSKLLFFFFIQRNTLYNNPRIANKMQNASHLLQNEALHSKHHKHFSKANICLMLQTPLP